MNKTPEYLKLYKEHFKQKANKKLRLLEIGVQFGGSITYWRTQYPRWDVWGLDIDTRQVNECDLTNIIQGDQTNIDLLTSLGSFDIVIDDGGHSMNQQQITFNTLYPLLNKKGIYVMEDTHTSYWEAFLDGEKTTSFIGSLTHDMHKEARGNPRAGKAENPPDRFDVKEIHMYPSISFIYKP